MLVAGGLLDGVVVGSLDVVVGWLGVVGDLA